MNRTKDFLTRLSQVDRRWIFLAIALGTVGPIVRPIGFPVSVTAPVKAIFDKIETLGPENVVMMSIDYGPTTAAENAPMADAVFRHCLARKIKVVVLALYPLGGLDESRRTCSVVPAEFPGVTYGVDYVNLGYKDGAQPAMRQMGENIESVYPVDASGTPLASLPLMQRVRNYSNVQLVVSLATGIIGEYWANLVNAQFGVPVAVGCTAVSAPKYYAYLDAKQMIGLMGGLKSASEYEKLVRDHYPEIDRTYLNPLMSSASRGMDVQTFDHLIIILFIVMGNVTYFLLRKQK